MLSFGTRIQRALQRTRWMLLMVLVSQAALAQMSGITGTLPEDYLPGLRSILESAVKQSPGVLLSEARIALAEANVYLADRERWPNVGGSIRYAANRTGVSGNSSSQSRDSGLFYNMGADQALYHFGAIRRNGEIARIEVAISKKEYEEAYRILALQIRSAYLGLIYRNAQIRFAKYALELRQAELTDARDKLARGAMSGGEVAVRELGVKEAQVELDRLQLDFDKTRRELARFSGLPDLDPTQIPSEIPATVYHSRLASELLAGMLRDGGRNTIAAETLEMRIKAADLRYKIERVRLYPKFNTGLSHSRESSTTASQTEVSQTAITRDTLEIRGNWTVFDGFATKGAKLSALGMKRLWQRQLQIDTEKAMDEAQQLERSVGIEARAVEIAEEKLRGADSLVKRTEEEAKAGTRSTADVNQARRNLQAMQFGVAQARAVFLTTWANFVSRVTEDPALKNLPLSYVRPAR